MFPTAGLKLCKPTYIICRAVHGYPPIQLGGIWGWIPFQGSAMMLQVDPSCVWNKIGS